MLGSCIDRLQSDAGEVYPPNEVISFNFTTFPDSRLARASGSHFRFIHARWVAISCSANNSTPHYYPLRYEPLKSLPSIIPLKTPFTTFSPSHVLHSIRSHRLRQPAWRLLSIWLADMRERSGWAQVQFAIFGDDLEMFGRKNRPMGVASSSQWRETRWAATTDPD